MRGLKDKVAIVAGAAPGNIGGVTAIRLAEEGMSVVVADLDEAASKSVVDEIAAFGGKAASRPFDITDETSYAELVDFTVKEFGGPDGLFNVAADLSASGVGRDSDVISVPLDVWRHTIDVTLTGLHVRHQACPPHHDRARQWVDRQHDVQRPVDGRTPAGRLPSRQGGPLRAHSAHRHAGRQARRAMQLGGARSDAHQGRTREPDRGVPRRGSLRRCTRPDWAYRRTSPGWWPSCCPRTART